MTQTSLSITRRQALAGLGATSALALSGCAASARPEAIAQARVIGAQRLLEPIMLFESQAALSEALGERFCNALFLISRTCSAQTAPTQPSPGGSSLRERKLSTVVNTVAFELAAF